MARVIYANNPMNPRDGARLFTASGPFIDFLETQFPTGFAHPYVVYRRGGHERVELDDFEFEMEEDEVVAILEYPGGFVVPILVKLAVSLVVSLVTTLILNFLFPPPKSAGAGPAPSPVYSFSARQNEARLGEPIPTIYGRMITFPNIISQPYYRYYGNQQYLHMILAVGHGWHTLNRVLIENDDIATLPAGTISAWFFTPDQHQRKIGLIEKATGVWEDAITSAQVAGQRMVLDAAPIDANFLGWFIVNPEDTLATVIDYDFLLPSGLVFIAKHDGSMNPFSVYIRIEIQSIDGVGNPVGPIHAHIRTYTDTTRSPRRFTHSVPVSAGRYRTRIRREIRPNSGWSEVTDELQAVGLRARLERTGQPAYGDTSILVVQIRASESISDQGQRRIRADVTRLCSTWRGPGLVPSSNPADHFYDIMTDPVNGAGRPISEIDIPTLTALHAKWQGKAGFNGQFDQRGTVLGGLTAVTAVEKGRPLAIGGMMSAIADGPQPLRATVFTPENIKQDTFTLRYLFRQDDPNDGFEIEFFDAKDFTQDVRIWPPTSVRPRTVPLLGCTSAAQALSYARLLWQRETYLRKSVVFETEMEGLIYNLGDRFGVAHPLADWGAGARVEMVDGRFLRLDKAIAPIVDPYVFLRSETGGVSAPIRVEMQANTDLMVTELTLATNPPFRLFGRGTQEPTFVAIGSGTDFVQDFVFSQIEPLQQGTVRITGILYDERVWEGVII